MTDAAPAPNPVHRAATRTAAVIVMAACASAATAYARRRNVGYVGAPALGADPTEVLAQLIQELPDGPGLVEGDQLVEPMPGSEGLYWVVEGPSEEPAQLAVMLLHIPPAPDDDTPSVPRILSFYVHPVALKRSMGAGVPCYWAGASGMRCQHRSDLPTEPITDPGKLGSHAPLAQALMDGATRTISARRNPPTA